MSNDPKDQSADESSDDNACKIAYRKMMSESKAWLGSAEIYERAWNDALKCHKTF